MRGGTTKALIMHEFHGDKRYYFDMTYKVTVSHIVPFIKQKFEFPPNMKVLEIGCGEAGVLKAFTDLGYQCTGIELEESRLEFARDFMSEELSNGQIQFLNKDIYDVIPEEDLGTKFDLIILKDVIEHIPNQEKFMPQLHRFLNPGGVVFFAFPPWQMPYGGHQQVLPGKMASKMPYYHLLPGGLYPAVMKMFGVNDSGIKTMKEIRDTGISIERFERICKNSEFNVLEKTSYLFNPIYEYKFGIKPKKQWGLIAGIPYLRNYLIMGMYYLVEGKK